jgi:3-hydroxybutyryl-CoA dehydrogenase
MRVERVFIQGAGTMGRGIAQVTAGAGIRAVLMDLTKELTEKSLASIEGGLQRQVDQGRMKPNEKSEILSRIHPTTDVREAAEADLVIEAVYEDLEVKRRVFEKLDAVCGAGTILASNTSALSIASIASATTRPEKVIGIHFMNPVPRMRGVEIIRAMTTSAETLEAVKEYLQRLGKEVIEACDYAGFIVSRVLDAMLNEAVKCVMDGNRPEEVDKAMKVCANFPMGPLELIDMVGAEIVLHGLQTMQADFGDQYRPAPLLRQMVRSKLLGKKTKKGFYEYP